MEHHLNFTVTNPVCEKKPIFSSRFFILISCHLHKNTYAQIRIFGKCWFAIYWIFYHLMRIIGCRTTRSLCKTNIPSKSVWTHFQNELNVQTVIPFECEETKESINNWLNSNLYQCVSVKSLFHSFFFHGFVDLN